MAWARFWRHSATPGAGEPAPPGAVGGPLERDLSVTLSHAVHPDESTRPVKANRWARVQGQLCFRV